MQPSGTDGLAGGLSLRLARDGFITGLGTGLPTGHVACLCTLLHSLAGQQSELGAGLHANPFNSTRRPIGCPQQAW